MSYKSEPRCFLCFLVDWKIWGQRSHHVQGVRRRCDGLGAVGRVRDRRKADEGRSGLLIPRQSGSHQRVCNVWKRFIAVLSSTTVAQNALSAAGRSQNLFSAISPPEECIRMLIVPLSLLAILISCCPMRETSSLFGGFFQLKSLLPVPNNIGPCMHKKT